MAMPGADALRELFIHFRDLERPLGERLSFYAQASRAVLPAYADAVDRMVERLHESGHGFLHAPSVGAIMPPFLLPDQTGRLVSLAELLSEGPAAIMFHRGHWCPYCRLNIHAVVKEKEAIRAAGGRVIIVMPERQEFAEKFRAEADAPFPVLTDMDNGYALSLNLAIWLGPDIIEILSGVGRDLPGYHGNNAWMLPIPATFVVGRDGVIVERFIDPDFRKRMEISDLLAAFRNAG